MYCWPVAFSPALPQHRYVVIQVVFLDRRLWPYRVQQLLLRDQPPGVLDQHKERVEHLQTERDHLAAGAGEPALTNVEMERPEPIRASTAVFATNHTSGKFQEYASVLKGRQRPLDSSLSIARTETAKKEAAMPKLLPDQSFYPSPTMAMQPRRKHLHVALLNPTGANDALAVLDVDPASPGYGAQIARVDMPGAGDELHHFVERVQLVPVPELAAPAYAAALSRGARHAIVANPHPRHRV